jgi:hypothetical protein
MPALGGQAADPRRGAARGGELRQAAGAAALVGRPTATTTTITAEHSYYSPSRINVGEILSMPPRILRRPAT